LGITSVRPVGLSSWATMRTDTHEIHHLSLSLLREKDGVETKPNNKHLGGAQWQH